MTLPPHKLILTPSDWQACLERLHAEPKIALDLEANSMYAYREQVCLIQISIPDQDYIVDPLAPLELHELGEILANPDVEKIFHAAEYDLILLKRQYNWQLHNLFDTMWAARILGYERYGLANMLRAFYGVKLNKRYQKANWCKRPLSDAHLTYAQLDTHFLLRLRQQLADELAEAGRLQEAHYIFSEQTEVKLPDDSFDPDGFWSLSGARDLSSHGLAILRQLYIYRDKEARQRNQPLFKILSDRTLVELARQMPEHRRELNHVHGMTKGQIRRYGRQLIDIIQNSDTQPPPRPKRNRRPADDVLNRYERLHTWRKVTAQERGVESDVIISRDALWSIAKENPQTPSGLAAIDFVGTWRSERYGNEILALLKEDNHR